MVQSITGGGGGDAGKEKENPKLHDGKLHQKVKGNLSERQCKY